MGLFDRMRQAQPLVNDAEGAASPDMSSAQMPVTTLLRRALCAANSRSRRTGVCWSRLP